jgi:hypothetical protein
MPAGPTAGQGGAPAGGSAAAGTAGEGATGQGGSAGAAGSEPDEPVGPVAPLAERFSVGPDFVCAVSREGVLACWGPGAGGLVSELGESDNRAVSVGAQYSCVLKRDGTPVCSGVLGNFSTAPLLQLDVGSGSFCGIEATDGRVVCQGNETSNVPSGLTGSAVSVAGVFACAVGGDARLSCWGVDSNGVGTLTPPDGSFSQVSAFLATACALDDTGQVRCWGSALVDPVPTGEFEGIAVGVERACALNADGMAVCWGFSEPADIVDVPLLALGIGVDLVCGVLRDGSIRCFGDQAIELPSDARVD